MFGRGGEEAEVPAASQAQGRVDSAQKPIAPQAPPKVEAIPAPVAVPAENMISGSFAPFARHALSAASVPVSVIPDPDWSWEEQYTLPCEDDAPAVLIDLDPKGAAFDPGAANTVTPGLGRILSQLRDADIAVFWSSTLPEAREGEVRSVLSSTGLDPMGDDIVLLARSPDENRAARRLSGVAGYCVVAIAADRQGDFDILFDHLRDRDGLVPFEPLINRGWFFTPPPLD